VLDNASTATVFDRRHIDYCCQGHVTLLRACESHGLDLAQIVSELQTTVASSDGDADPRTAPTSALISRVLAHQHRHLRANLLLIGHESGNRAREHGARLPVLRLITSMVSELSDRLHIHLDHEEGELFPELLAGPSELTLRKLGGMFDEHREFAGLLRRMRELADDYAPVDGLGENVKALYRALRELESLILRHDHVENHVLLPRFK